MYSAVGLSTIFDSGCHIPPQWHVDQIAVNLFWVLVLPGSITPVDIVDISPKGVFFCVLVRSNFLFGSKSLTGKNANKAVVAMK